MVFEIVESMYFWCHPAAGMIFTLDVIDLEHWVCVFRDVDIKK
jgi:hypothetical protein